MIRRRCLPNLTDNNAALHPLIWIVHINGVHHLPVYGCHCESDVEAPLRYIQRRLLPCSFKETRTVFSFALLDYARLCNLELKASPHQLFQLLQQLSSKFLPLDVPSLQQEFRCMLRIWRWIKKLKWHGFAHGRGDPNSPASTALAVPCLTCPQEKLNLSSRWIENPDR